MANIRVGLAGFGLSGRYLQAPFFEAHPEFDLHAIATSRADAALLYPHARRVHQFDTMLDDPDIDLISIATPNDTHVELTQKALLAGKHVLVDKPFAPTLAEAKAVLNLARDCKKQVFIYQNRRFDSDFLTIRQVIDSGRLGDLVRFEAHYNRFKNELNPKKWKETPAPGSGILYDLGAHLIDQSLALFGIPQSYWGKQHLQRTGTEVPDAFDLMLDYGRLQVHLSSSLLVRADLPRYVLHGTGGSFVKYGIDMQEDHLKAGLLPDQPGFGVEPPTQRGMLTDADGQQHIWETLPGRWMSLYDNIADVLLRDAAPAIDLALVLAQVEMLEQCG